MSQPTPLQQANARALLQHAVIPVARVIQDAAHDIQAKYGIDEIRMERILRLWLVDDAIVALPSGNYQVRSESDPLTTYLVNPAYESCTCPDSEKRQLVCKHLGVWLLARELNRLPVVRDVIGERETKQRAERAKVKKVEYYEELDLA